MMKYLLFIISFVSSAAYAQLHIELVQPTLLLSQLSSSELGIKPQLNEEERKYSQLISEKLKQKHYQALLSELTSQLREPLTENKVSAAMAYLVGQLALQQEKYSIALQYFKQAIRQEPSYAKAYHGLGLTQLKLQKYAEANTSLTNALKFGINDSQLYSYLGYGYLQNSNFHSAVVAYQQAKLFNPNDKQLNQALLFAYSQAGQSEAALSLLTQMIAESPNEPTLWLHRANALLQSKNYPLVIASLETALRLGELSAENVALTAQLQMQHGSIDRALELYLKIWQQHENPQLVLDAVEYLTSINQLNAADKFLKKLKSTRQLNNQQQSQLAYLRGKILQQQDELSRAEKAFAQALKVNSVNGYALLAGAQVKRALGKTHQAQMLLLRASNLDTVKLSALTEHADLMMSLGRYAKALEFLQLALAHAPHESSIFENVKTLQRLVNQSES